MMALPEALGRYVVIGELATGGMAQILLGRVTGPSGFERPVVIKRILPHLASQPSFVAMFLDEARIVARIRHRNVVTVQELVREGDELFMVLEYLEGESCWTLLKRLLSSYDGSDHLGNPDRVPEPSRAPASAGEARLRQRDPLTAPGLDPALCAYVVAEACAGLHAAHELQDEQGRKLDLVHRDVSPQNLFVTYDGQVKLLDFGIAQAADRIARTEAGQVKGKFEYMSPEHCRGERLDRRSDIFALGAVLYELSTGRRLFHRASFAETLRAICSEAIPPSRLVASYPRRLESICMRALAQAPSERYATADEMRRDLLGALRDLGGPDQPGEALAGLMRRLFPDRIAEKQELLRRFRSGSTVSHVPAGEVHLDVEVPAIDAATRATISSAPATVRRRGRRRLAVVGGGAAVAIAAAAAAGLLLGSGAREPEGLVASRPGQVAAYNVRAVWSTPNGVYWKWDLQGVYTKIKEPIQSHYGIAVATSSDAIRSGAAPFWTGSRNAELAFNWRGQPVLYTLTDEHPPDTELFAQVQAVDENDVRSVSEIARARTASTPSSELPILTEAPARGATIVPEWLRLQSEPRDKTDFPLCRGAVCFVGRAPPCDDREGCRHNLKFMDLNMPLPPITRLEFEKSAYLEFAFASNSTVPLYFSYIWIDLGHGPCRFEELPLRSDNRYQVVQVPLRALAHDRKPFTYDTLEAWRAAEAVFIREIAISVRITTATLIRIDDVRLRW